MTNDDTDEQQQGVKQVASHAIAEEKKQRAAKRAVLSHALRSALGQVHCVGRSGIFAYQIEFHLT